MPKVYLRENSKVYQVKLRTSRGYTRRSTGTDDETTAQRIADDWQAELDLVQNPSGWKFSTAHEDYIEIADLKEKTKRSYKSSHRMLLSHLGDFHLNRLGNPELDRYIKTRLKTVTPARIKRDMAYLSSLYVWACNLPDGPETNPVRVLDLRRYKLKEARPRERWLTEDQFSHLLGQANEELQRRILITAVDTGMRRDELLQLQRRYVSFDEGFILLPSDQTKNSQSRLIPMTRRVKDTLRDTGKGEYMFVSGRTKSPLRSIHGWWYSLVERADLTGLRFHDLRHTFTSWATQRGVPELQIQLWLGHKTRATTRIYQHLRRQDLMHALTVFDPETK